MGAYPAYKKDYGAMVFIDGTDVVAISNDGSVIDHGTAGTDDATVIQAAVDYVVAATSGGKVNIGAGTFDIDATISLKSYIQLCGEGVSTVLYAENGLDDNVIDMDDQSYCVVENLWIVGNSAGQASGSGIYINHAASTDCFNVVKEVVITDCKEYGVEISANSDYVSLLYTTISGCGTASVSDPTLTSVIRDTYGHTSIQSRRDYDAMVFIEGTSVIAVDSNGVCIARGVAGTDDATVIQAAIGNNRKVVLKGTFYPSTTIDISYSNLEIEGSGCILDFSSTTFSRLINGEGTLTGTISVLAGDMDAHTKDITLAVGEGSNYSADDWVLIRSDAVFNGGSQKYGEIYQVDSVVGDVVTLKESVMFDYLVADSAEIEKVTMLENVKIKNIAVHGNPTYTDTFCITFYYCAHLLIDGVTTKDTLDRSIMLMETVDAIVTNCSISNCSKAGLGYGVSLGNASRNIIVDSNNFTNCRHAYAQGGNSTYGVQTNLTFSNNTITQTGVASPIGAVGAHNTYDGFVCSGNTVVNDGLGYFAGIHNTITGNNQNGGDKVGLHLTSTSLYSNVVGNTLVGKDIPIVETFGSYINIIGNYIENTGTSSGYCITQYIGGTVTDMKISNNMIIQNASSNCIYFRDNAAGSSVDDIVISDNYIDNRGAAFAVYFRTYAVGLSVGNITIESNCIKLATDAHAFGLSGGDHDINFVKIRNNTITGTGTHGIYLMGTINNLDVIGNDVTVANGKAIHCQPAVIPNLIDNKFSPVGLVDLIDLQGGTLTCRGNIGYVNISEIRDLLDTTLEKLGTPRLLCPCTPTTGTSITDYTRLSNTLTAQASVLDWHEYQGRATYYDFNGTAHYLYRANDTDFDFGDAATDDAFSVVCCVNPDDVTSRQIIGKWDDNNQREWRLFFDASGYPTFQLYDESADTYIGRQDHTAFTTGSWQVLVATYDGSGINAGCKIYIDGVQLDDTDYDNGVYVAMEAVTANLMVGALKNAAVYSEYYDGKMTWIGIAAKELSPDEVWSLTQRLKGVLGI